QSARYRALCAFPDFCVLPAECVAAWGRHEVTFKTAGKTGRPATTTRNRDFMASAAQPTREDFAALLEQSMGKDATFEGKVVKGTVTAIENDMAVIDVGLKSEGRVALREFAAPGQKAEINVGDEVEVYVDRVENANGEAMLSRDR